MSNAALDWAWGLSDVPPPARLLLVAYADHANTERQAWPGTERLAARTSLKERSIRKWRAWLVGRNLLQADGWAGRTLRFVVNHPDDQLDRRAKERHEERAERWRLKRPPKAATEPGTAPGRDLPEPEDAETPADPLGGAFGGGAACREGAPSVPLWAARRAAKPPENPKGKFDARGVAEAADLAAARWREFSTVYPRLGTPQQADSARRAFPDACAAAGGYEQLMGAARAQQDALCKRLADPEGLCPLASTWLLGHYWNKTPPGRRKLPPKPAAEREHEGHLSRFEMLKASYEQNRIGIKEVQEFGRLNYHPPEVLRMFLRWYKEQTRTY